MIVEYRFLTLNVFGDKGSRSKVIALTAKIMTVVARAERIQRGAICQKPH